MSDAAITLHRNSCNSADEGEVSLSSAIKLSQHQDKASPMRLLLVDARFIEVEVQVRSEFACLVVLTPVFGPLAAAYRGRRSEAQLSAPSLQHSISTYIMKNISHLVLS